MLVCTSLRQVIERFWPSVEVFNTKYVTWTARWLAHVWCGLSSIRRNKHATIRPPRGSRTHREPFLPEKPISIQQYDGDVYAKIA